MSNLNSHTPGPWEINNHKVTTRIFTLNSDDGSADVCDINRVFVKYGRAYANAKLIAAAPEMLEALIKVQSFGCRVDELECKKDVIKAVKEAIEKATGVTI